MALVKQRATQVGYMRLAVNPRTISPP